MFSKVGTPHALAPCNGLCILNSFAVFETAKSQHLKTKSNRASCATLIRWGELMDLKSQTKMADFEGFRFPKKLKDHILQQVRK